MSSSVPDEAATFFAARKARAAQRKEKRHASAHARICHVCHRDDVKFLHLTSQACTGCTLEGRLSKEERESSSSRLLAQIESRKRRAEASTALPAFEPDGLCFHCGRPWGPAPTYSWSCPRGFGAGLCQGISRPHTHRKCQRDWAEQIEAAPA